MRKKIRKTLKYSIFSIILIVIVALIFPTWTPKIKGENSISMLEQVEINGTGHEVMIRGVDRTNPILIFVHGGPGCSEIPYVRKYQKELEQHFTVVHYDQRGSGKSYHFFEDYSNLTTDVLVDDLLALRDYVSKELGQEKVILIGHSFGTYIGMKAAAKAPTQFHAYIGIGQMANTLQSELESLEYTYEQAKQAGNEDDVKKLELIRSSIEQGKELTPRILLQKYGGAARLINENRDYISGFLLNPEYNGLDMIRFYSGMFSSQDILLREAFDQNLPDIVDHLEIPTYFVTGKYDYMTTANAARDYFDVLDAPIKDFIVFNESAHYPQLEEKEKFVKWLNELF
ncbi:alpha/beta hydrolase [Paenibacillus sp. FSL H7-0942]|uniref:alpha/beta fold hydrolase n=1 Tax=Paenibacillus TaxID=44249 RepID=UPI0003E26B09|nr:MULTISPECIES: alpha/beta hydrolase [Paenibacillus]ETT52098.1 hydrolase, alpha/beta fold family protein [Paenibacillus sp. FSL H7-689]OMF08045.1 alpha/beta hydrolase [Paenibacillus amylolyticus]